MKYYVTFQEFGKEHGRPIDHPSTADFESDGLGMLPNVGDYVEIEPVGSPESPRYSGRVKSRLFRYMADTCGVNIVVEDNPADDWGKVIKE
ncbi:MULTISPECIES: hypothetical protein [Rhizobium]|uniref:hypothetical protein n=1 Tax=Rhizobium TaxID=379 RepID=UPI001031E74F|nr:MULTISPECIES: hypothetical protein [Rhizobium]MBY3228557.1 hypothetical protein [Rhizobium laguerreae]TBF08709.1 hypothetical protein ELG96_08315 [Rhizobium ruizarguesonis]